MADDWYNKDSVELQGTRALAVVPSDTTDLNSIPKALYVGGGGDIMMIGTNAPGGSAGLLWKAVPTGAILPFRPRRILAAGTSATNIVAIY